MWGSKNVHEGFLCSSPSDSNRKGIRVLGEGFREGGRGNSAGECHDMRKVGSNIHTLHHCMLRD